ncbi:glycoside hydrolase, partial [Protomyces lactucae-debilis]
PKLVVYFEQWGVYARNYTPADLPISIIDEVSYAFAGIKGTYPDDVPMHESLLIDRFADLEKQFPNGVPSVKGKTPPYAGNFGEFLKLKQHGNAFNFSLSLGGYTGSGAISAVLANTKQRKDLLHRIDETVQYYGDFMTGVSIDWEYPAGPAGINYGAPNNTVSKDDRKHFSHFLHELRCKLGHNKSISVAVTGNVARMDGLPFKALAKHVDQVHLMSYDYGSSAFGDTTTVHAANLYKSETGTTPFSADEGVEALLKNGIHPHQIFIGVPTYSRGFANTDGLGKSCSGTTTDMSWEAGVLDYKAISPHPSFKEAFDVKAGAGYAYSAEKRELLSYDTPESVRAKAKYVVDKGLGGIIVWAASGD